jgi:PRTRC genetic system protein B
MYFNSNLNIPNGQYCIPGLVWMVQKGSLSLFAYKSKRLTPNSPLYSAPFFNVRPKCGSVCLGSAKLDIPEEITFQNLIKYWEDKFFLSEFSHILGDNPTRTNPVLVTMKSVNSFDNDELKPVKNLKLKDLLK